MKYDSPGSIVNEGDPIDMVTKWTSSVAADFRKPEQIYPAVGSLPEPVVTPPRAEPAPAST